MGCINSERVSAFSSVVTTIITGLGLWYIYTQVVQSNTHKSWDNYNTMNNVYRQMYVQLQHNDYEGLRKNCLNYPSLNHKEKAWIRSYYNLYAEEFDLDDAGLLPENMMDETISRGFRLNLQTYPSIAQGFDDLLLNQAYDKKSPFAIHVKKEIQMTGKLPNCENKIDGHSNENLGKVE